MQARDRITWRDMPLVSPLAACRSWLENRPLRTVALVFGLMAALVYSAMPAEELTFDNGFIIEDDTRLREFGIESVINIVNKDYWWPSLSSSLYRPLTTFSFWLEYSFLGFANTPFGYQAVNLLLHLANALLVCTLALRLKLARLPAFIITTIFLLHPVATEVVANIVGRSDLFATMAVLGGLICYLNALEIPVGDGRRLRWLLACGACGLAGVMAKESAIMLPALVGWHGLLRMGELRKPETARMWCKDALGAGLSLLACVAFIVVTREIFSRQPGVGDHPFMDNPLMAEGFWVTRITAMGVWGMQLKELFLPLSLSSDYSFNAIPVANLVDYNATTWWGVGTILAFVAAGILLWRVNRDLPLVAFVFGAYVIAMLPTSNLLIRIGSIRADRFHYLPSAFLWLGLAFLILHGWRLLRERTAEQAEFVLGAGRFALVAWVLCLGVITHSRCHDWRSNLTLWRSAQQNAPGSVKTAAAAANEMVRATNTIEGAQSALAQIEQAIKPYAELGIDEADWPLALYSDYGAFCTTLYDKLSLIEGRKTEADAYLSAALEWLERGIHYEGIMRKRWADRWGKGDLEKAPRLALLHKNYGIALLRAKRFEEALAEIDLLIERQPYKPDFRELKASMLHQMGRVSDAVDELMLLSVMVPDSTAYIRDLGNALKEVSPESNPLARDGQGAWRLDLSDAKVLERLKRACEAYKTMLVEEGAEISIARFTRVAKHVYGLEI